MQREYNEKLQVLLISFIALVLILSGCSKHDKKHSRDHEPKELKVEFVPSQNSKTLNAKVKPLQRTVVKRIRHSS